jgi:hypothetical protein
LYPAGLFRVTRIRVPTNKMYRNTST